MEQIETPARRSLLSWYALALAVLALAGSLLLSLYLGLKACPLCLYQRSFVMGVVAVMGVGLLVRGVRPGLLSLLSLPLASAALAVVIWHVTLEAKGALECPLGLLGFGSAPVQSLCTLSVLVLVLLADLGVSQRRGGVAWLAGAPAIILGLVLAVAAIKSAPPAPPAPAGGYPKPVNEDGCRPPYRPVS
jgi:disulfide bond formation protein DsbB